MVDEWLKLAAAPDGTDTEQTQRVVLVTGPSGAGRSTAINVLEDLGYEAIDNLPLSLVPRLLEGPSRPAPLALGLDVRNRDFSTANVIDLIDFLTRHPAYAPEVVYLDCAPDVLVRRYSETRRRHPLVPDGSPITGIAGEIDLLIPIRDRAEVLIDTSELTPHDLKAELSRWFDFHTGKQFGISIHSFSYKRGVPRGLDIMFDCRFLANPHWNADLRGMNGTQAEVQEFVKSDPRFEKFFTKLCDLVTFLLPALVEEGKTHLAIGFGCTGGQHRSVSLVEELAVKLADTGHPVSKRHRELERRMSALLSRLETPSGNTVGQDADPQGKMA